MTGTPPPSDELATVAAALTGQYTVLRELGRGGMGVVYLARDERLDRPVALKVLPAHLAGDATLRERFLREARTAAQLSHPHIVPVYRADEAAGVAYFAMGFVDGPTFGERLRERGTLPVAEVVRTLREVAWALAYAHARGIVHRDVKPDNILLERGAGRALVTDFGIARTDMNAALTQDGHVLGTVHFMSPEQAVGEPLDGRSDLYALGCIGYLALSGRLPFTEAAPQAVLVAHATRPVPPLRSVAPDVPAPVAAVIDQCLRKAPGERYATGEALAEALAKALEQAAAAAPPVYLSESDAMAVWRRAAELQAEAAAQLEQRLREARDTRALPAAAAAAAGPDAPPTDSYKLADVQAAAAEAGISARYVALALDERRGQPAGETLAPVVSPALERVATRMFGALTWTVTASRTYRMAPREVLQALGQTLQAFPWSLHLEDTLGGHPLDGGTLVFALPGLTDGNYRWTWTRYGVYVPQVRVTLAAVPGDPGASQVTMAIDLRQGLKTNVLGYGIASGGLSLLGGLMGAVAGKAALSLAGAALLGPAAAAALVTGVALFAGSGWLYRWEVRQAIKEMQAALAAIDAGVRARAVFGDAPPPPRLPPGGGGDDATFITMVS
jgi:eukaryotic-like serine/threonine-protein kinase